VELLGRGPAHQVRCDFHLAPAKVMATSPPATTPFRMVTSTLAYAPTPRCLRLRMSLR
jgi:hypothetical protein